MIRQIPNFITCLNLFSGCIGIVFAFQGDFRMAAICMLLSGVFDFFDGMVARLLKVSSPIGKELDSLADVVSFGFLPGVIWYQLLKNATDHQYLPYLGFVVTVFSAVRLAKFNLDERQTQDFIGLNTPMNAFFVMSLPFIAEGYPQLIANPMLLILGIVLSSALLVSELRLFSMKLTSLSWAQNRFKYLFLIFSIILLITLQFVAVPLILLLYMGMSVLHFSMQK